MFWSQESKSEARAFIETWLSQAKAMDNRHLTRFANTVESHIETILAWYEHPITSGPLEGLNNKIKVLKRSAYGYRDFAFFGLRLAVHSRDQAPTHGDVARCPPRRDPEEPFFLAPAARSRG